MTKIPTYHRGERNFGTGFDMMGHIELLEAQMEKFRKENNSVVPKVKPLVWRKSEKGVRFEETVCGSYVIYYRSGGGSTLSYGATCETVAEFDGDNLGRKAKAAAQADHEARILSKIDMAPVTVQEGANG